jgi:hypothetical protein
MADLWLVSRSRVESLTDRETVRLGRVLIEASSKALGPEGGLRESSLWFPDAPRATVVIRDYAGQLSTKASQRLAEVLGDFDTELQES